jgi:HSP20 family protein
MAIVRYEPLRNMMRVPDLWEDWDRLSADGALSVDVYETDSDVVVSMPMPGVNPEDINVTVSGDTVTVRGEVKEEQDESDKKRNYYFKEVRRGSCARSVTLPAPVKSDHASATTKNGVLTLTLPKAEEAKPRSIKVSGLDTK